MKKQNNKIDYEVLINPNEVLQRIAATADLRQIALFASGSKTFTYSVSGNVINIRKRITYRNNFRSSLSLKVEPTSFGSKLAGRFSMGFVPVIFLAGWLIIIGGLSLLSIISISRNLALGESLISLFPDIIPILMFVGGLVMFLFVRFLAKGEKREISEWLNDLFAESIINR